MYENVFPLKNITLENVFKAPKTVPRTLKLLKCSLLETCNLSLREQGKGCKGQKNSFLHIIYLPFLESNFKRSEKPIYPNLNKS